MSKNIKHEALELRIRRIFRDRLHPDHQDVLQEIFPEIYADVQASEWNNIHKVGHIYARLNNDLDYIASLLMPVIIPYSTIEPILYAYSSYTDNKHELKSDFLIVLNLIAGNFWKDGIPCSRGAVKNNYDINDKDWNTLFKGINGEKLIHLGTFNHGSRDIYMQGKHDTIRFFKLDES